MTAERWRAIPGYEGAYEVSDQGRVRSVPRRDGRGWRIKGRVLAERPLPNGYLRVSLWKQGKGSDPYIHRLVLLAFVGPAPQGTEACHGDGVRTNNRLENLRWDTPSGNAADKKRHGTDRRPRRSHCKRGHAQPEDGNRAGCRICGNARTRDYMRKKRLRDKEAAQ